jgi:hypothetical protein
MANVTVHFVNEAGEYVGRSFTGPAEAVEANTPEGCRVADAPPPRQEHPERAALSINRTKTPPGGGVS